VNIFLNPVSVGFYVTALGLSEGLQRFSSAVATVLFPKVSADSEADKKIFTARICRNVIFVTFVMAIFLTVLAKWMIVFLYSKEFLNSVAPFQVLLFGTIAFSGWMVLHTDIYGREKPMLNTYIIAVSGIVNILLNLFLIPRFGIMGTAWSLFISYLLMFLITLIVYLKLSKNNFFDVVFIKKSDIFYYANFLKNISRNAKNYIFPSNESL
jgi:O-antigen/teichoic acid export membrane protein